MKKEVIILLAIFGLYMWASDFKLVSKTHIGIDVSHHNHLTQTDWKKLKARGVEFVYIKASEGKSYKDPDRFIHANNAYANNIYYGYYLFFHDNVSSKKQFNNYMYACDVC